MLFPAVCSLECEAVGIFFPLLLSVVFGGHQIGSHKRTLVDVIEKTGLPGAPKIARTLWYAFCTLLQKMLSALQSANDFFCTLEMIQGHWPPSLASWYKQSKDSISLFICLWASLQKHLSLVGKCLRLSPRAWRPFVCWHSWSGGVPVSSPPRTALQKKKKK